MRGTEGDAECFALIGVMMNEVVIAIVMPVVFWTLCLWLPFRLFMLGEGNDEHSNIDRESVRRSNASVSMFYGYNQYLLPANSNHSPKLAVAGRGGRPVPTAI